MCPLIKKRLIHVTFPSFVSTNFFLHHGCLLVTCSLLFLILVCSTFNSHFPPLNMISIMCNFWGQLPSQIDWAPSLIIPPTEADIFFPRIERYFFPLFPSRNITQFFQFSFSFSLIIIQNDFFLTSKCLIKSKNLQRIFFLTLRKRVTINVSWPVHHSPTAF